MALLINSTRYRPDVNGLRAVAVLAVVLFHAGLGCPGGFVGVDVFFVISGFLITSLIWKDLESGSFTFAMFWERRARRIIPALVVMTLVAMIGGWFFLLPAEFKELGQASAAQAVFAANFNYWRGSGYFAGAPAEKTLLHTWSLAVEEQFYLIVPFLLWGMFRYCGLRTRKGVILLLATGFAASFAASIYGVSRSSTAAFYLLPTRAWELLMGSLAAFVPGSRLISENPKFRGLALGFGMALILVPVFTYSSQTPFPGLAALPPCLGAAVLIWIGHFEGSRPTLIGQLLSNPLAVFIGLISYSLYLWHWPLLALGNYITLDSLSTGSSVALVTLAFLCAVISWKYVETPFRQRQWGASRKSMFAYAWGGLAAVFVLGLACMQMQGFPQRFPAEVRELANAKQDSTHLTEVTAKDVRSGKLVPIGASTPGLQPTVFVWGDSHAMAAMPAVDAFLKEKNLAGQAATHSSVLPILDLVQKSKFALSTESTAINESVFDYIRDQKIPEVVLIGRWSNGKNAEALRSGLLATVRKLVSIGSRPWIMLDVPAHSLEVPRALALAHSHLFHVDIQALCAKPATWSDPTLEDPNLVTELENEGGRVLDPKPAFLDPTGHHYLIEAQGCALYSDRHHLTTRGARMLLPLLQEKWAGNFGKPFSGIQTHASN